MPENTDNGNQRVTVAILKSEIGYLRADLARFCEAMSRSQEGQDREIGELKGWRATSAERWASHEKLHTTERGILGTLSAIFSAIAGAVGVFVNKP